MSDKQKPTAVAAMLEMARIVNESARKEREMWLRVVKQLRELGVR